MKTFKDFITEAKAPIYDFITNWLRDENYDYMSVKRPFMGNVENGQDLIYQHIDITEYSLSKLNKELAKFKVTAEVSGKGKRQMMKIIRKG